MQPEPRTAEISIPPLPTAHGDTILIVEDNQVNAMILSAMLRKQGHEPLLATDGHEGIRLSEAHRPRLILMDLQMPSLDGVSAAREIRRRQGAGGYAPFLVAVTASVTGNVRATCQEAGFVSVLAKPIMLNDLCEIVERYLPA
jgi:CheY-like chemotaxis protein